jgi:FkbM family methyltransferase
MLKRVVKRVIHQLGFDLVRYEPSSSESAQLMAMLKEHDINLIFDVGANTGQFGKYLRYAGYEGRIVSFEPLATAYEKLLIESSNDPLWEIHPRTAIGDEDGELEIHVAGNSQSSSALKMLDAHAKAAPDSVYIGNEKVPLTRFDSLASQYFKEDSIPFIKIDTQGYEDKVLVGAVESLKKFVGIQLELSLIPLYEGQLLHDDLTKKIGEFDFELWAMSPVFSDPKTGRLLQIDATFFKYKKLL